LLDKETIFRKKKKRKYPSEHERKKLESLEIIKSLQEQIDKCHPGE